MWIGGQLAPCINFQLWFSTTSCWIDFVVWICLSFDGTIMCYSHWRAISPAHQLPTVLFTTSCSCWIEFVEWKRLSFDGAFMYITDWRSLVPKCPSFGDSVIVYICRVEVFGADTSKFQLRIYSAGRLSILPGLLNKVFFMKTSIFRNDAIVSLPIGGPWCWRFKLSTAFF